jgi:hypothetical protein
MKFSYQAYHGAPSPTVPTGIIYRPEVAVKIIGTSGWLPLWPVVDTGSDDTLLPLSAGRAVGAKLDKKQTWTVQGFGGQPTTVILGEVTLEMTAASQVFRWPAKVGFVDFNDPVHEVAVLGHSGFLDYFRVICDGHLREIEVDVTPAFPGQVI